MVRLSAEPFPIVKDADVYDHELSSTYCSLGTRGRRIHAVRLQMDELLADARNQR